MFKNFKPKVDQRQLHIMSYFLLFDDLLFLNSLIFCLLLSIQHYTRLQCM